MKELEVSQGGEFMYALRGWQIHDRRTGEIVPHYILWWKVGCELNDSARLIMKRDSDEFIYQQKPLPTMYRQRPDHSISKHYDNKRPYIIRYEDQ